MFKRSFMILKQKILFSQEENSMVQSIRKELVDTKYYTLKIRN